MMELAVIFIGVLVVVAIGLLVYNRILSKNIKDIHVQRKSRMLMSAERAFFEYLIAALSEDYYIFAKANMLDVIDVSPRTNWLQKRIIRKRLASIRMDYVLCQKHDLSIFGVVELENFSKNEQRRKREKLVSRVCQLSGIRLFYFDVRQDYRDVDIHRIITGRAKKKEFEVSPTHQSQLTIEASVSNFIRGRSCPKCNGEVATKVAVKGKHMGEKFLMCRKYPYCDYQVPMAEIEAEKARADEQQREKSVVGYKHW